MPDEDDLAALYRRYIDCLNRRDWGALDEFVRDDVAHNGRALGLAGYRAMLEQDCRDIPDLAFKVGLLVCDRSMVAARLMFDCTPAGRFLGLPVDGRRIRFSENVFYQIRDRRIQAVFSVIDKAAIETALKLGDAP